MRDCTGMEICEEWLYHLGVPEDQIEDLAKNRGVPKVWGSVYDVLDLLDSAFALRDGKKLTYGTWFQGKDCVESIVEKNRGTKYSKAAKRASSDLTMLF